nr:RecName: Full=Kunitz-type serine protease inhibitor HNTX-852; Flags: Precursor [Haplopelma hainanum]P0DJ74.1 RecName: Full=Kunitz-type serine protease inhibitor HNTX-0109076; Flags: Precursor [Haplopelma hainanum]
DPSGSPHIRILPQETFEDICRLPSDSGDCLRFFEMWYFDGTTCTKFVYGGYGGNDNRFPTEKACMKRCAKA